MTAKTNDRIAQLEGELKKLKAQITPTPFDPAAEGKWRDQMHQMRERNASAGALSTYTRDQLREMEAACPPDACRDIARHGTIPSASIAAVPTSQQLTGIHNNPGIAQGTTGWRNATPIGPPPGVNYADKLMDAQDARDRAALITDEVKRRQLEKAMKP